MQQSLQLPQGAAAARISVAFAVHSRRCHRHSRRRTPTSQTVTKHATPPQLPQPCVITDAIGAAAASRQGRLPSALIGHGRHRLLLELVLGATRVEYLIVLLYSNSCASNCVTAPLPYLRLPLCGRYVGMMVIDCVSMSISSGRKC